MRSEQEYGPFSLRVKLNMKSCSFLYWFTPSTTYVCYYHNGHKAKKYVQCADMGSKFEVHQYSLVTGFS